MESLRYVLFKQTVRPKALNRQDTSIQRSMLISFFSIKLAVLPRRVCVRCLMLVFLAEGDIILFFSVCSESSVRDKIINQVPIISNSSVRVCVRRWLIHPFFLAAGDFIY